MASEKPLARALAQVFAAGPLDAEALADRARRVIRRCPAWIVRLNERISHRFAEQGRVPLRHIEACIRDDAVFLRKAESFSLRRINLSLLHPEMGPRPGSPGTWHLPALTTEREVADWLGIAPAELDWLADCKGLERTTRAEPLRNYVYTWIKKRSGARRLIEAPKPRLKALQRRVLRDILEHIPPHEAVHGFRRGRSILTYVAPHVGQRVVLRLDLAHFFPSIARARIFGLFHTAGYPDSVARLLAGLCTNTTPSWLWDACPPRTGSPDDVMQRLYLRPHLPQGAPTSPALANLCAYRLDCRLAALAQKLGAQYTRYADDLAFSGDVELARRAQRLHIHIAAIALEEGFAVHTRKTRIMRQGVRQQLAGVVVNQHTNLRRHDYDALKATLFNCIRHGPEPENHGGLLDFRAHLAGRVAFVSQINPQRGRRLQELLARIRW